MSQTVCQWIKNKRDTLFLNTHKQTKQTLRNKKSYIELYVWPRKVLTYPTLLPVKTLKIVTFFKDRKANHQTLNKIPFRWMNEKYMPAIVFTSPLGFVQENWWQIIKMCFMANYIVTVNIENER